MLPIRVAAAVGAIAWLLSVVGIFILEASDAKKWDKGRTILDKSPGWSQATAVELFDAIGPDGCRAYNRYHLLIDSWVPFAYNAGVMSLLYIGSTGDSAVARVSGKLLWAPVATLASDELENLSIMALASSYASGSGVSRSLSFVGSACTMFKFLSLLVLFGVGLVGSIMLCCCTASRDSDAIASSVSLNSLTGDAA
mmetsp:Transcript_89816/g.253299  ORF Transcript_89816/g.253299 Transcript_89816/m.253299 type:complete len:197 (-) Transcript_89816:97-687(-)|eukprot:CAMPEP_0117523856 /NCGR_PEP_ID=MMETSP0784-20121206/34942_1 /TAXON_ID=39447 /ORGANISM="" /LENGTH=196 /DNA_ID=CAMNT_0005319979 /DNA_START=67 /DNA_END=657 /DNA_ORIENTATION=-